MNTDKGRSDSFLSYFSYLCSSVPHLWLPSRFTPLLSIALTAGLIAFTALVAPATLPLGRPVATHPATMAIHCQIWHGVRGAQITDALASADLQAPPTDVMQLNTLEFAPGFKDEWACSLSGLITPLATGRYVFNIAARDSGVLFLSTDDTPAHRRFIAEVPAATDLHTYRWYSAQTSPGIQLIAGHSYFIQAICKSGPGPGGISIAWTLPNGKVEGPIASDRFRKYSGEVSPPDRRVHHATLTLKDEPPATQPGIHKFVRGAHADVDGDSQDLSYLMFTPKGLATGTEQLPMLVFLHGNSRQGYSLSAVEQTGPIQDLERSKALADWMPMVVMVPQLPPDWRWDTPGAARSVNLLVEQLCKRYPRIDRSRIYLTGISMGGKGTWLTLEDSPQTYAAVAPISAVDVRPDQAPQMLKDLRNLHIICGGDDNGFTAGSKRMYEALKPSMGDKVQLTVWPHEGHNVWDHYYPTREFYEGLLKFSR
jgi:hypothetical protein